MDEQVQELLDLARSLIEMGDLELSSRALLANLYALAAMRGVTPRVVVDDIKEMVPSDSMWITEYLEAILGEST